MFLRQKHLILLKKRPSASLRMTTKRKRNLTIVRDDDKMERTTAFSTKAINQMKKRFFTVVRDDDKMKMWYNKIVELVDKMIKAVAFVAETPFGFAQDDNKTVKAYHKNENTRHFDVSERKQSLLRNLRAKLRGEISNKWMRFLSRRFAASQPCSFEMTGTINL